MKPFDALCYFLVLRCPVTWWRGRWGFVLARAGRYAYASEANTAENAPRQPEPASGDRLDADVGTEG
jgi:hypothetical protein